MVHVARRSAALVASVALATLGIGAFVSTPSASALTEIPFAYTGDTQTYDVPTDGSVCFVGIAAAGANGGDSELTIGGNPVTNQVGGIGGTVFAAFAVTPGDTLDIDVGGRGGTAGPIQTGAAGGFGGGGDGGAGTPIPDVAQGGGGGGGGATTIRNGSEVLLVAGGGGGGGMAVGTGGAGGNGGGDGGSGASGGAQAGSGGGGGGGTAAAGGGGGAAGGANATAGEAGVSEAGGEGGDALGAAGNGGGGGGGGGFFGGGGGGGADGESGASGGGGGGGSGFASPDAIAVLGNLEDAITQDVEGNGRALIITVGCAAVAVFKVVDSAPPGPTTFTVRVACTSGSTDLTYDESGSALGEEIFEAEPGDTCSVTETGTGGASHTTYRCTDLFGEPCGAGGQQIQFTSEVTPQIALVIVTNSFVLEVQPRLAG